MSRKWLAGSAWIRIILWTEYEGENIAELVTRLDNVAFLYSFTKMFSIPGLRLGYVMSSENNIERMLAFKEPWTVNLLAQFAGEYLIRQVNWLPKSREAVSIEKEFVTAAIRKINNLCLFGSSTNFFLLKILSVKINSTQLQAELIRRRSILIRDCSNFVGLNDRFSELRYKAAK